MGWSAAWLADEGKGILPRQAMEELRLALVERITGKGDSTPAELVNPVPQGLLDIDAWTLAFQTQINRYINIPSGLPTGTAYLNHTDHGGNWDGEDIPLYAYHWTEALMLTAIGDASRLDRPSSKKFFRPWGYQQYKMLDMLRWIWLSGLLQNVEYRQGGGVGKTWEEASAEYDASSWSAGGSPTTTSYSLYQWQLSAYTIYNGRADFIVHSPYSTGFTTDIDFYASFVNGGDYAFWDGGIGAIEDKLKKLITWSGITDLSALSHSLELDKAPHPAPNGTIGKKCSGYAPTFILKFDGVGGFEYLE